MNLELIKLIRDEVGATDTEVDEYLEHLVQQSGGWGLRQVDRIFLSLARVALEGAEASNELDEIYRKLKGQQMESGRYRKQLENLQASNTELAKTLDAATASSAAKDATIASMEAEIKRLQEAQVPDLTGLDNES